MRSILSAVFAVLLSMPLLSAAQKVMTEGSVIYKAVLNNPDGTRKEGTYVVTVKNKQVRKELKIGTDFNNVTVLDEQGKSYILRSFNDKNFAVEMSAQDFSKRHEKYREPAINDDPESREIAGFKAQKATVTYKDGTAISIYYTKDWIPELPFTFERFRGLNGFPLAFDYKNDQGAVINFEAVRFDEAVVENSNFKIPAGYTLISNEEYRKLKSK
jgi:GLPGLI family protein